MNYFESNKNPVFFIAEIGGNHEGDFEYAEKLVRLAADSGADAVKFQIYSGDTLVSKVESPGRNEHFKKFELSREQYIELALICRELGVIFMASVWDAEMLGWIDEYIPIHKVGSGDLTAYPIIETLLKTGKPLILSTGLSTLEDVQQTLSFIEQQDRSYILEKKLALLQCTASYPCPDEDVNLNAMLTLGREFDLPTGYSDHSLGCDAVLAAVAMGAEIIEMHFTDTRIGKTFRDHKISVTCDEIKELLEKFNRVKTLQGSFEIRPTASELEAEHVISFRRSVYARRDIRQGETFSRENLTLLRPAHGISPAQYYAIIDKKAARDIKAHEVLREADVF